MAKQIYIYIINTHARTQAQTDTHTSTHTVATHIKII